MQLGWRNLIARGCLPSVFQHPGWADAWWRSLGDGRDPFVVVGRDGDTIVGIVPLMVDLLASRGVPSAYLPEILDADVAALSSLGRPGVQLTPGLPSPLIELPATWDEFLARHDSRRVRGGDGDRRACRLGSSRCARRGPPVDVI